MLTHCVLCRQEIAVLPELRQGATLTRVPSLIFKVLTGYRNVQIAIRSMAFSFFLQPLLRKSTSFICRSTFGVFFVGFFFFFFTLIAQMYLNAILGCSWSSTFNYLLHLTICWLCEVHKHFKIHVLGPQNYEDCEKRHADWTGILNILNMAHRRQFRFDLWVQHSVVTDKGATSTIFRHYTLYTLPGHFIRHTC